AGRRPPRKWPVRRSWEVAPPARSGVSSPVWGNDTDCRRYPPAPARRPLPRRRPRADRTAAAGAAGTATPAPAGPHRESLLGGGPRPAITPVPLLPNAGPPGYRGAVPLRPRRRRSVDDAVAGPGLDPRKGGPVGRPALHGLPRPLAAPHHPGRGAD